MLCLGLVSGCKKKQKVEEAAPAPEQAAAAPAPTAPQPQAAPRTVEKLPGESAVRAALKRKDYNGAVSGLAVLSGPALKLGAWEEYRQLSADVANGLAVAARTDPNAAQALATYQMMNKGR
jgi:hypothetical protein